MEFYNTINYKGREHRYVFTNPNPSLGREIANVLAWHSLDMSHEGDTTREISEDDFEIRIYSKGPRVIGMFSGIDFDARIDSEEGTSSLGILILKGLHKGALN